MPLRFTHPQFLWLLPLALAGVVWLAWKTDVQTSRWRWAVALTIRTVVLLAVILAIAGLQWLRPVEGMNVLFLLDRSDSVPSPQQEAARKSINQLAAQKKPVDRAGLLVFGADAAIETSPSVLLDLQKIDAVVGTERTDVAAAIRLGTAAFPETGQKRLVLLSDGNENVGDALTALQAARPLGATLDVVPMGTERGQDVSVQKLGLPSRVKEGQTFEVKILIHTDQAQTGAVRILRNQQPLGEQRVELSPGKNLFTFPEKLTEPGFYDYTVLLDAEGDTVPQNNRATSFVDVRGDPRVLVISADPDQDRPLVEALRSAQLRVRAAGLSGLPSTLAELQSYDAVFISNLAAGDLGQDTMRLLESAVRDFGVGLVCLGGDQAYAAGGYRNTPLETALPVHMELDSKKVLPNGAVALVMHGMEFMNGNQIARECALGVLDALGPRDELGVILLDGQVRWLFPLQPVAEKRALGRLLAGMNQGDLPGFQDIIAETFDGLRASTANLKHMIVFSDGDPAPPSDSLMASIVNHKITVSTVLIAGHAGPDTMIWIADRGKGRFYNISNPAQLPQIFIKEAAVILKSAIKEEPFRPKVAQGSELIRGIGEGEFPPLRGYVCATPKPRAEVPLVSHQDDPVLAHWQYGLGRAVAFTSDANAKWARDWLGWEKYRQFWAQVAQWSLRRVEDANFTAEVSLDQGAGHLSVEAFDAQGNYRNFLHLQAAVVSPKGDRQIVRLEQSAQGRYEAQFPTRQVGTYVVNLLEVEQGRPIGSQALSVCVNYSPEFEAPGPNLPLLQRLAEAGGGQMLDPRNPADNPFQLRREKTFQPRDLWEWLLQFAVILFTLDVGVRRIQIDRAEWTKWLAALRRIVWFWRAPARPVEAEESLAALLTRRDQVRAQQTARAEPPRPELFRPVQPPPASEPAVPPSQHSPSTPGPQPGSPAARGAEPSASTASRLLEAKRRAQKKKG